VKDKKQIRTPLVKEINLSLANGLGRERKTINEKTPKQCFLNAAQNLTKLNTFKQHEQKHRISNTL
jgi:hypothetical protein